MIDTITTMSLHKNIDKWRYTQVTLPIMIFGCWDDFKYDLTPEIPLCMLGKRCLPISTLIYMS